MIFTVIGAGAIGSAIAYDLIQRDEVTQVQICDARARSLQDLHAAFQSPKLRSFQVDARDHAAVTPILRQSICVIGSVSPQMNPYLARLCLTLGLHFCDLGGNDDLVEQVLRLDAEARERGVWIVPNCGLAPGLVNILCLHGIEQLDTVKAAHLRVGDVPRYPEPPFNFHISWSAEKVLDDYTNPVQQIADGVLQACQPLTSHEMIHFPEPFGQMEAFCTAGSLSTLPATLNGRVETLDFKTIRWPGHADQMRFLLGLGLGERRSIDVRTHLTYRDVLIRRMKQRLTSEKEDAVLLRVLLQGTQDDAPRTLVYELVAQYDEVHQMTAMKYCTSIPTASVALLVASGQAPGGGAAPPERVVPKADYLAMLNRRGLDIRETWHDGYVDVRQPGLV